MNEYIGKNIRELRKTHNLTQEMLAEKLGTTFQSVSRWENGVTYPDIDMIPIIARYFNVTSDYLFGISCEKNVQKMKALLKELESLPESGTERAVDIIRMIRLEYDMRPNSKNSVFHDMCQSLYCSEVKKTSTLADELRKAAEVFFDSNPNAIVKSNALQYYVTLEDEHYIPSILNRYATDESCSRDALLYERYLYRDEFDKLEVIRQKRLCKLIDETIDGYLPWKEWRAQNDLAFAFWKNNICLDFLHSFTNETPTDKNPITCGLEPDVFAPKRILLGELRACYLVALDRQEEALIVLEDVVSLIEQLWSMQDENVILSRSPALPTFSVIVKKAKEKSHLKLLYANDDLMNPEEAYDYLWLKVDYDRLMNDSRWAWFDPIRNDDHFLAIADRIKTLMD